MSIAKQASLWAVLAILTFFALASALLALGAMVNEKKTSQIVFPVASFFLSLGGIVLVNLVTSDN